MPLARVKSDRLLGVEFSPLSRGLWRMHFSLTPWRRFPGHSLPLSVLESRSRLSAVRASPTAWSPGTIFRSSRLRARHQITGCPWANKVALFADPSCGEEHRALGPGMESKGRAIRLREPQRGSLIPPIEGQSGVGHQLVGGEPRRLLPCKDRGDNIRSEKSQPHKARRIRSRDPFLVRDGLERRTVRPEHSLGDFLTTHEQSDQDRIHWRRIVDALDDELHLLAGSLQARANAEPNQSLFGGHCHGALGLRCSRWPGSPTRMNKISYTGYRFPPEIIHQAIWLYLQFTLSLRDVEDLLAERGVAVSYETVRRWVNHFGPMIAADLRKRRLKPHT